MISASLPREKGRLWEPKPRAGHALSRDSWISARISILFPQTARYSNQRGFWEVWSSFVFSVSVQIVKVFGVKWAVKWSDGRYGHRSGKQGCVKSLKKENWLYANKIWLHFSCFENEHKKELAPVFLVFFFCCCFNVWFKTLDLIYQNQRYLSIQDLISYCIKEGISEIVFK